MFLALRLDVKRIEKKEEEMFEFFVVVDRLVVFHRVLGITRMSGREEKHI